MLLPHMIAPSSITSLYVQRTILKREAEGIRESCIGDDMYHSRTITILLMRTIRLKSAGA